MQQELARLHADMATLRQQLATLMMSTRTEHPEVDDLPAATDVAPEALPLDPVQTQDMTRQQWQEEITLVENSFQAQAVESRWASQAVETIVQVNQHEALTDLVIRDVDCRTSLCRVELEHDDPESLREALPLFALQVAGALPTMAVSPSADDEPHVVVFLSRDDFPFGRSLKGR